MAKATDQERVAEALGLTSHGSSRDRDGANGTISKQFTTWLRNNDTTLDEIIDLDKKSFEDTVDSFLTKINTYGLARPFVGGLLKKLRPKDPGTQNRNIRFRFLFSSSFSINYFVLWFLSFLQLIGNTTTHNDTNTNTKYEIKKYGI